MITANPKIMALALLAGIIPSLFWLWFWIQEEGDKAEPRGLLTVIFILGMIATIFVLPVQKFIQAHVSDPQLQLIGFAAAEEIIKFLAVLILIYNTNQIDEATDWPIYLITAALGFAALENALFLIKPFSISEATVALLTGQLRFLGSTLLHTVTSGTIGIMIGISFFMKEIKREWLIFFGFLVAIALHSAFNFFIIRNDGNDFLKVFAFLWVVAIIVMLLFEKVRRMSEDLEELEFINN